MVDIQIASQGPPTGTSGHTVGYLDGTNTFSGQQTFSSAINLTSGQIIFPATQSAAAGANILDDYEEGTWTPGLAFGGGTTSIAYTTQSGIYTKIGAVVICEGTVTLSNNGSSTGSCTLTGLPFTVATVNSGVAIFGNALAAGVANVVGQCQAAATTIALSSFAAGTATSLSDTTVPDTATFRVAFSFTV